MLKFLKDVWGRAIMVKIIGYLNCIIIRKKFQVQKVPTK